MSSYCSCVNTIFIYTLAFLADGIFLFTSWIQWQPAFFFFNADYFATLKVHKQTWNRHWSSHVTVLIFGYTPTNNISISCRMAQGLQPKLLKRQQSLSCIITSLKKGSNPENHSLTFSVHFVSSWGLFIHHHCSSHKLSLTKATLSNLSVFLHHMNTQGNFQHIFSAEFLWSKTPSSGFALWHKSWETIHIQNWNLSWGIIKDKEGTVWMLYKKHIIEFMVLPKLWIISFLDCALKFQQRTKNSFSPFNLMD